MIALLDYDAGNMRSVENALRLLNQDVLVTRKPDEILNANGIILPGVGCFGDAMDNLQRFGLVPVIHEAVDQKIPFLGICLGLQLLFERSEESPGVKGLGLLKGEICRIPGGEGRKIPHMGWNDLAFPIKGRLFEGLSQQPYVYFVHSYYVKAEEKEIVTATSEYGVQIHASVEKDQLFGCQFHPEKSSAEGLKILSNFARLAEQGGN